MVKISCGVKKYVAFKHYENNRYLLKQEIKEGKVYLIVYVDACFVYGEKAAVQGGENIETTS